GIAGPVPGAPGVFEPEFPPEAAPRRSVVESPPAAAGTAPLPVPDPVLPTMFPAGPTRFSFGATGRSLIETMLIASPAGVGGVAACGATGGFISTGGGVGGSTSLALVTDGTGSACTRSKSGKGSAAACWGSGGLGRPGVTNCLSGLGGSLVAVQTRKEGSGVTGGTRSGGDAGWIRVDSETRFFFTSGGMNTRGAGLEASASAAAAITSAG